MDFDIYRAINARGPHLLHELFRLAANDLTVVIVALVALLFLIRWRHKRLSRRQGAVAGTAAAALALLINQPISHAVDRARPYVAHPHSAHLLIARSHDPSFPSDHATGAFALATAIWFYDRLAGTILLALATLLSFARVYVGTHYPGDVLGGALIALLVTLALIRTPLRHALERVALALSGIWDRVVAIVLPPTQPGNPRRSDSP